MRPTPSPQQRADRATLATRFPAAISPAGRKTPKKPLCLDFAKRAFERGVRDPAGQPLTFARIDAVVEAYRKGARYDEGLATHAYRIGLDGEPASLVSPRDREEARARIEARRQERRAA